MHCHIKVKVKLLESMIGKSYLRKGFNLFHEHETQSINLLTRPQEPVHYLQIWDSCLIILALIFKLKFGVNH